jgi:hypothetical protein
MKAAAASQKTRAALLQKPCQNFSPHEAPFVCQRVRPASRLTGDFNRRVAEATAAYNGPVTAA